FPDVRANTVSSSALSDYEWLLGFEPDELHRIVDLMRALRAAEARRHTRLEVPFYTGRRKSVADLVASLPWPRPGPGRDRPGRGAAPRGRGPTLLPARGRVARAGQGRLRSDSGARTSTRSI